MRSRSIPNTKLCHLSSDEGTPVIGKGLGDWETWGLGDWGTGRLGDWETGRLGDWGTDEPGHVLYGTGGLKARS